MLAGEGAGRLRSIATGVIISKNGLILTALHAVKGATEVQVRLSNGEVFDHVTLLGFDERRDVAAIRIAGRDLPELPAGKTELLKPGAPVYAVTNMEGRTWSATEGVLSAIRPADEVPGAGTGFTVLQFSASITPGASGGALVDGAGQLIGIITAEKEPVGIAVPIQSVLGLPGSSFPVSLGSGSLLQLPSQATTPKASPVVAGASSKELFANAKTVTVRSKTAFLTVDTVIRALTRHKNWPGLGINIVQDQRLADVIIEFDRPLFTYVHTFVIMDKRTSVVLGSGKVTAIDGTTASGGLADDIVKLFVGARSASAPTK